VKRKIKGNNLHLKKNIGLENVVSVIEHLPSKHEALSSNLSNTIKGKRQRKQG
jgi:hypothetical protein